MTVVPTVPLVSSVSVSLSVRFFGDSSACSASVSLVSVGVSVMCLVTAVPAVPLVSLASVAASLRCFGDSIYKCLPAASLVSLVPQFLVCPWYPYVFLSCALVTLVTVVTLAS